MWPFKRCKHVWDYRKIYGDEIHMYGGERDLWTCAGCGKRTHKAPSQAQPTPSKQEKM